MTRDRAGQKGSYCSSTLRHVRNRHVCYRPPETGERQGRVQILRREKPETFVLVKTHVPTVAVGTFVLYLGLTGKAHADSPSVQLGGLHASRHATQRPPRRTEVNEQGVGTGTRSDHA
jgi:hypothetical protein